MKTILDNRSKLLAVKYPFSTIKFLLGDKITLQNKIILQSAKFLFGQNFNAKEWLQILMEIDGLELIPMNNTNGQSVLGNNISNTFGKWIYCLVRFMRPNTIVETGVSHGVSSWVILNALHKNKVGKLFSIDLPNNDLNENYNLSSGTKEPGWVVPELLRSRWVLNIGDSKDLLLKLLLDLKNIDLFFHDSDHSYDNMKFEFETTLPFINPDGIIISDDIYKNKAFEEFINTNVLKTIFFTKGGCSIINK